MRAMKCRSLLLLAVLLPFRPAAGQACSDYPCDSLAVRAVLDSNGLTTVDVGDVATARGGRVDTLHLARRNLQVLPADIGRLSGLLYLNVSYSRLESLTPAIAGLSSLLHLDAGYGQITALPAAIGVLAAVQTLDLQSNALSSIPSTVMGLSALQVVRVWNNPLDSVDDSVAAWLEGVYQWWRYPIRADLPQGGVVYHPGDTIRVAWSVDTAVFRCVGAYLSVDSGENYVPLPSGVCMEATRPDGGAESFAVTDSWVSATNGAALMVCDYEHPQYCEHSGWFTVAPASGAAPPRLFGRTEYTGKLLASYRNGYLYIRMHTSKPGTAKLSVHDLRGALLAVIGPLRLDKGACTLVWPLGRFVAEGLCVSLHADGAFVTRFVAPAP